MKRHQLQGLPREAHGPLQRHSEPDFVLLAREHATAPWISRISSPATTTRGDSGKRWCAQISSTLPSRRTSIESMRVTTRTCSPYTRTTGQRGLSPVLTWVRSAMSQAVTHRSIAGDGREAKTAHRRLEDLEEVEDDNNNDENESGDDLEVWT